MELQMRCLEDIEELKAEAADLRALNVYWTALQLRLPRRIVRRYVADRTVDISDRLALLEPHLVWLRQMHSAWIHSAAIV